jgi:hypothetical protein
MELKERKAALRAVVRTLSERAVRAREEERLRLQARRRSEGQNCQIFVCRSLWLMRSFTH